MTTAIEVSGGFDLTDEIMRGLGKDPYALDKARFLSATLEFRMKLAIAQRKRQMWKALDELPQLLDDVWADVRYSPRERRRILYELWYETDQTPEGGRAAKMIDAFIRRRLPCGGADGYTPSELEAFRKSHPDRPFSPGEACGRAATERDLR